MITRVSTFAAALAAALATSACEGGLRQSVGLTTPPPDEFLVVARRPLEMPPSLDALPPPSPGAASRVEPDPVRDAQLAIAGRASPPSPDAASRGEAALLAAAGADAADPAIRATLAEERPETERRFGLDYLLGYPIEQDPNAGANRLDPTEEARRLREQGLPVIAPPPEPEAAAAQ